jgi:uncharacterized membrane protein YhaH (DUF805 family)
MDWFIACVTTKYATFSGRSRRQEFWMFTLVYVGILIAGGVAEKLLKIPHFSGVLNVIMFLPSIAVAARRLHDVGKSGWYQIVPIYNLYLYCCEGERGPNHHGSDPKSEAPSSNLAA